MKNEENVVADRAGVPSLLFDHHSQGIDGWMDGDVDEHNKTGWIGKNKLEEVCKCEEGERKYTGIFLSAW